MSRLRHLLTRGFFPREVPQGFVTTSYGEALTGDSADLPTDMTPGGSRDPRPLARHNLALVGHLRRPLSVPHPARYFVLCREITENWHRLSKLMEQSRLSVSKATFATDDDADRAIITESGPPDYPTLRAKHRRNARYLVYTDIQRFYPSIYTHSIAWAVDGKEAAKHNRSSELLGNRLDSFSRRMQDGQSLGIPIGPDTSRVLAEVVLSAADCDFQEEMGERVIRGFRAVDDYELAFGSRSEAEEALARLQSVLLKYELQLNESKTRIVNLPDQLQDSWPTQLGNVQLRTGNQQVGDFLTLFSTAFELARTYRDKGVLRYAISITNKAEVEADTWPVYQDILLQCAVSEPGTLRYVTAELARARDGGKDLDVDSIRELSLHLINKHAPLGHDSEVAWALWLVIVLKISLPADHLDVLARFEDPFVPVLTLCADDRGLISGRKADKTYWEELVREEGLDSSHWLLAYEGAVRGWLASDTTHVIDDHAVFRWFQANDVSFFDEEASVVALNRWTSAYGEVTESPAEPSVDEPLPF